MEKFERVFVGDDQGNLEARKPSKPQEFFMMLKRIQEREEFLESLQKETSKLEMQVRSNKGIEEATKMEIKELEEKLDERPSIPYRLYANHLTFKKDEDIVRTLWRHRERGRNVRANLGAQFPSSNKMPKK